MANGFASGLWVVLAATAVQIAGAASSLAAVPESGRLDFAVMRNGDQIGLHEMKFHKTGNDMQVDINTKVAVKIAFLTVYHFDHEGHEVWRGGNQLHLWSQTDDDGTTHVLDAAATAGGLEVRADGKPAVARDPRPIWDTAFLTMIDIATEPGMLVQVSGSDGFPTVGETPLASRPGERSGVLTAFARNPADHRVLYASGYTDKNDKLGFLETKDGAIRGSLPARRRPISSAWRCRPTARPSYLPPRGRVCSAAATTERLGRVFTRR